LFHLFWPISSLKILISKSRNISPSSISIHFNNQLLNEELLILISPIFISKNFYFKINESINISLPSISFSSLFSTYFDLQYLFNLTISYPISQELSHEIPNLFFSLLSNIIIKSLILSDLNNFSMNIKIVNFLLFRLNIFFNFII
jgi:hypothetical protein